MMTNYIILAMECVGTVAFVISGSLVAVVVLIRMPAAKFRLRLPKIKSED